MNWLWRIDVVDGPVVWGLRIASIAALAYVFFRRRGGRVWYLSAIGALAVGALIGLGVVWLLFDVLNTFNSPLISGVRRWAVLTFAGITLALLSVFWRGRWWRRLLSALAIIVFLLTGFVGINRAYGLQTTIGAVFHINTDETVNVIHPPKESASVEPKSPLYTRWKPPADMPAVGQHGPLPIDQQVPNTASGFPARPAEVYYPPAALVQNPPALPFVLMMMGQPGDPDSKWIGAALDKISAEHDGLAPIVLVVDQLGDPAQDPLCIDGKLGNVETYVMQDVVPWVQQNLHVMKHRDAWTVAGYSAGGGCALYFGAKYPKTFGNIVSISGEVYSGAESAEANLQSMFDGDQAAYDAIKPTTIYQTTSYPDTHAYFSAGSADPAYVEYMNEAAASASTAGIHAETFVVPGGDHVIGGLTGGLDLTLRALYPRLGLAPPP